MAKQIPGGLWIPADILSLTDVSPTDMCIMARVDSFRPQECSLSNKALGELLNVSEHTVKHSVRRCRAKGDLLNRTRSKHFRRLVVDHDRIRERGRAKIALPKAKRVGAKVPYPPVPKVPYLRGKSALQD